MATLRGRFTRLLGDFGNRAGNAPSKKEQRGPVPDVPPDTDADEAFAPDDGAGEESDGGHIVHFFVHNEIYVRGWVVSRSAPSSRLRVELFIDGQSAGVALANHPRPNLRQTLGSADIHHGFEFMIPSAFYDGKPHEIAMAKEGGEKFARRCSFVIAPETAFPTLEITELRPAEIIGMLRAPSAAAANRNLIGIWVGDKRVPSNTVKLTIAESADEVKRFSLALAKTHIADLIRDNAIVAIDGAYEIGAGVNLRAQLGLGATRSWNNTITVTSRLLIPKNLGLGLQARIFRDPQLQNFVMSARLDLSLGSDEVAVKDADADLWVALGGESSPVTYLPPIRLAPRLGEMIINPMFRDWDAEGPRHWLIGDAATNLFRSFHAFPEAISRRYRLSGDSATIELSGEEGEILRQHISHEAAARLGQTISFAIAARATAPLNVTLLLGDGSGVVASAPGRVGTDWNFIRKSAAMLRRSDIGEDFHFSLLVEKQTHDGPVWLEIAGIASGDDASFAAKPTVTYQLSHDNLIENAKLTSWPHGLDFTKMSGRFETASGWFVYNRQATLVPQVFLKPAKRTRGKPNAGYSLSVVAEEVKSYCRLEIRLHGFSPERLPNYRLSFIAGIEASEKTRWATIDRLYLLRRALHQHGDGTEVRDTRIAAIASRVLLTNEPDRFAFESWTAVPDTASGEPAPDIASVEYFVVLEFLKPFGFNIQDVELAEIPAADGNPETGAPTFEDRGISAQIPYLVDGPYLHGLKSQTAEPGRRASGEADVSRWSWRAAVHGSVDVIVCMHNAVDETLACLKSLCVSSSVPHTVCVVDDASSAIAHGRVREFISDKPWIRLIRNEQNLGYTRSANRGIFASDADWVILLNSDTIVTRGWIEGLLECATSRSDIACAGPLSNAATYQSIPEIHDGKGKWRVNDLPPDMSLEEFAAFIREKSLRAFPSVPLLNGFCTLINRTAFVEVGGFNEAAFPAGYGEENDLCARIGKAGYRICVADHVYVYHHKSASFGAERRAELSKNAGKILRDLHPDIDFNALGRKVGDAAPLAYMRDHARSLYRAGA
jgi:GT2 family glycosyltransferase